MGRPRKTASPDASVDIDALRERALAKFTGLSEKLYNHVVASFLATKPCMACSIGPDGKHVAGKYKDADGLCAMCHGSYAVPDMQQRNWAAEMAQPIAVPAPKSVEVKVEQKSNLPELLSFVKQMNDSTLTEKLALLGVEAIDVETTDSTSQSRSAVDGADSGPSAGEMSQGPSVLADEVRQDGKDGEKP